MVIIDADVEFKPEAIMRMLVTKKDILCTPYRVKNEPEIMEYAVKFKDPKDIKILPWDIVEIEEGPAGCMLIHRRVFEGLMKKRPDLGGILTHCFRADPEYLMEGFAGKRKAGVAIRGLFVLIDYTGYPAGDFL